MRPLSPAPTPRPRISRQHHHERAVARLRRRLEPLVGRLHPVLGAPCAGGQALGLDQLLEPLARRAAAHEGHGRGEAEQPEAGVEEAGEAEGGEQHLAERHGAQDTGAHRLPERGLHVVPVGHRPVRHQLRLTSCLSTSRNAFATSATACLKAAVSWTAMGSASRVFGMPSLNSRTIRPGPRRHDPHPVPEIHRLGDGVGDDEHGGLDLVPQVHDEPLHLEARRLVEGRERLVHQDDLGLEHERSGDRHPLLLPARELVRVLPLVATEADLLASTPARGPRARSPKASARSR